MFVIYLGLLLFGGVLIAASALGGGDHDAGGHGDADAGHGGDGHDHNHGNAWLSLFGLRFWSFAAAFFGLTGLVLRALGWPNVAPVFAAVVGVGAGLGASIAFRALLRDAVGQVKDAGALVGREGSLLLPTTRGQRGKVRLAQPGSGHIDLLAETDETETLEAGAQVLIVEMRGNVAAVERAPGDRPAPRS